MALPPGTRLGAYEVRAQLGAGGMGAVYRAHDPRLGRDVALKVLHPEVARDANRLERFTREARAVAALNHPHIVTIYSTEEADGVPFMTMELVEGQALDELIPREGLALTRFFELALPLADALAAAHQKQITHRDLKPANVMVAADGRLKVLDFGLARVASAAPEQTFDATRAVLTVEGTIVGTMPYMSPEQVEGRAIDARSDLFSLGVMFYEMLAGTRPFKGPSSPALMSAILRDDPEPLASSRSDVPEPLVRLVSRCLEKRPEERVQTARDVFNELRHAQKQAESGPGRRSGSGAAAAPEASLWIAVLPFGTRSADADTEALAAGLTEDITGGLSRFPALSVVARESAQAYRNTPLSVQQIAERLGARYVLGGTVRRSAAAVRIATHLVDAKSGAHLWTETYDQPLEGTDLFAIQDDVTDRIVATIADKAGVLARSMVQTVRQLPLEQLSARELILRCWMFQWQPTPDDHATTRTALEHYLAQHPLDPHVWAELANFYICEHSLFFNPLPDALGRAMRAARRAVELDPGNQEGWEMVALASFYRKDEPAMIEACDRTVRLNPRNSNALAWMGSIRSHAGDYDAALVLSGRARTLNQAHPGWYHFTPFNCAIARGDYAEALRAARRVNMPEFMWMHFAVAAASGHLGLAADARSAYERMAALAPALADDETLHEFVRRWYWPEELIERLLEGVARAKGSEGADAPSLASQAGMLSTTTRPLSSGSDVFAAKARRVAVVPFTSRDDDADATALADGLTDDITTGLSRFPHLRVVPAGTAATLTTESAGRAGVRYLLEGRVQGGGSNVRVTVRLIDGTTGTNLWADTFDRPLGATAFEVQDDLASYVVATVGDTSGVLARSMAASLLHRPVEELTVRELVLRFHAYVEHFQAEEHARLRSGLERALEREPAVAEGWACLADLYEHEHSQRLNPLPDSLGRQRRAAQRAVEIDPHNQRGWTAMAAVHTFERDRAALRMAAERAIALNPLDADTLGLCALFLSCAGDDNRAMELFARAVRLKPQHPGWYHFPPFTRHYKRREYAEALAEAKCIALPQLPTVHISAAAAAARAGSVQEAQAAVEALRRLDARFLEPESARQAVALWIWDDAHVQDLVDGLAEAVAMRPAGAGPQQSGSSDRPRSGPMPAGTTAAAPREMRVAVLPFTARGGEDATALAEGLRDEITTGLARFPYVRVVSPATVATLGSAGLAPEAAAERLGARFLLEGSVRRAGSSVRASARLVDAESGAHIWAETFDRDIAAGVFAIQDDLAGCITSQVADPSGALVRTMAAARRVVPLAEMSTADLTLQFFAHLERFEAPQHAALRDAFERVLERAPNDATAWGCLADLYMQEITPGLNPRPDAAGRQRAAAERAIALDATTQYGWLALATRRALSGDRTGFVQAGERAIALNPLNTHALGLVGNVLAVTGDWDRGLALVRRALALNPHVHGHVHLAAFLDSYRRGDDEAALASAKRFNIPTLSVGHLNQAAAAGQLGRADEARAALEALRRVDPALCEPGAARETFGRHRLDATLVQRLAEGFDKALALTGGQSADDDPERPRSGDAAAASQTAVHRSASGSGELVAAIQVAVQPFSASTDDDARELARGLTDDVTTGLSRFRYVRVRTLESGALNPRQTAGAAHAAYVLDGAVRRSGTMFRVSARLTKVATGEHAWAEQYQRDNATALFELQDDVASRIVATLADGGGVFNRIIDDALRSADPASRPALMTRMGRYVERFTPDEHLQLRDAFETLVARGPDGASSWGYLAVLYGQEILFDFNPRPEAAPRVRSAAERAVALDPDNQTAWYALACAEFFDRHRASFASAAERSIEINPLHSRTLGGVGLFYAFAGDTSRGAALVTRAMALNPRFPGWFHIATFVDAYQRGDSDGALAHAARINMPHLPVGGRLLGIAAAGKFGRAREAEDGLRLVADVRPDLLDAEAARREWSRWIWEGELLDALVDGYAAALAVHGAPASSLKAAPTQRPPSSQTAARPSSGVIPAAAGDEAGMGVAVLPFSARGGDDASALAEGLTDDITTALARFPYLHVVTSGAVGARFLLEGAVRSGGSQVRVSVHLSDAQTGAHVWAETFDRDLAPGVFAIQDDIVGRVAATVADGGGVLVRALANHVKSRPIATLDAAELVLRYHGDFAERFDPADHAALRDAFEAVVAREPDGTHGWACLAMLCAVELFFGVNPKPDPLARLRHAAERANALDPAFQHGWVAMATAALFGRDRPALQAATDRALALNPFHSRSLATLGLFTVFSGETERGMQLVERALALNPRHPGWCLVAPFLRAYERGEFDQALGFAKRIGMPNFVSGHLAAAAAAGQVGTVDDARPALDALARFNPRLIEPEGAREVWSRWIWSEGTIERLVEGLEKALTLTRRAAPPPAAPAASGPR